ncbi:MAG: hypothetical protein HQK54_05325, partial [Oligoflexales bacterium]|nr:hypothetical protein [Oligoflexales bacterium]
EKPNTDEPVPGDKDLLADHSEFDLRKTETHEMERGKFGKIEETGHQGQFVNAYEKSTASTKKELPQISNRSELIREFPEMERIIKIMLRDGIHVESQVPGYIKHYYKYGPELFRLGLRKAILTSKVIANELGHLLEALELEQSQGVNSKNAS